MRAVTRHDVLRPSGDCRSDDVVVIHIVGYDTRDFARRHDCRRVTIGRYQLLDRWGGIDDPLPKPVSSEGISELGHQHGAHRQDNVLTLGSS